MGADLSMMSRDFRPRPNKVYWEMDGETQVLVIERDTFPGGYQVLYRGKVDGAEALLKAFGIKVPPKPPKPRFEVTNYKGSTDNWQRAHMVVLYDGTQYGTVLKDREVPYLTRRIVMVVTKDDFIN